MTLRIIGDIIELDHRPVGFITIPSGTMRDGLVELLEGVEDTSEVDELRDLLGDANDAIEALERKIEQIAKIIS